MNVDSLGRAIAVFRNDDLVIDEDFCLNDRARREVCRDCAAACPPAAIRPGVGTIELDEDACTGCGACVPACRAGALRLVVFDPARFLASLDGHPVAHVHCAESRDGGGGVVLPCHAMIDARLAAAAAAAGTTELVLHGIDGCAACKRGDATEPLGETRGALRRWFGDRAPVLRAPEKNERGQGAQRHHDQRHANRRGFLGIAGLRAVAAATWLVPVPDRGPQPAPPGICPPGVFRQRAASYQEPLATAVDALPWRDGQALPWYPRHFTEACTVCQVCALRCPTGALAAEQSADRRAVTYGAALCTNCGLCGHVCPENAVKAESAMTAEAVATPRRVLAAVTLSRCGTCGHSFAGDGTLCPECSNENAMDDEWLAMLGG